jgi:hypothetical protein
MLDRLQPWKCKTDTGNAKPTQRENSPLPCVEIFAVRFFRAHGKGLICRAFFIQRMAKKKRTTNVLFAVRYKKTKKRTTKILFPDVIKKRTVKIFFAVRFFYSAHQSIFLPLGSPNKPNVIFYKILCHAL